MITSHGRCGIGVFMVALAVIVGSGHVMAEDAPAVASNVIVVTLDGMRWQEVFGGVDPMLVTREAGGVSDEAAVRLRAAFARDSAEASRAAILPFFWEVVAKRGQAFGDRGLKNVGRVSNTFNISYPGYHELLCGFADPRVNSNKDIPNPNVTVLEWLNVGPGLRDGWRRTARGIGCGRS